MLARLRDRAHRATRDVVALHLATRDPRTPWHAKAVVRAALPHHRRGVLARRADADFGSGSSHEHVRARPARKPSIGTAAARRPNFCAGYFLVLIEYW